MLNSFLHSNQTQISFLYAIRVSAVSLMSTVLAVLLLSLLSVLLLLVEISIVRFLFSSFLCTFSSIGSFFAVFLVVLEGIQSLTEHHKSVPENETLLENETEQQFF